MRIAHVSDIHIRNLRYHDEYRRVFDDLYGKLRELRVDMVVNTGDTAHTKTQISPEFVQMTSEHIRAVAAIAPYHIILGNHDLNLMNRERQDAISPIVESLRSRGETDVYLHKSSGRVVLDPSTHNVPDDVDVNIWVFSLADVGNYPRPSQWAQFPDDVNIGLFHGSVAGCVTDSNWRMTHTEHDLGLFEGLDFVMLGDIHKQQFFNGRRFGYAGSLIQQNFGEDIDKGFLLWDIDGKGSHDVRHVPLRGSRRFYTLRLGADLSFPDLPVEEGSRIRVSPPREMTLAEQREVEALVRRRYSPYDVITLAATNAGTARADVGGSQVPVENLRQLAVQDRLIRDFLAEREVPERVILRALDLNRRYQVALDQGEDVVRNVGWKLNRLMWSNVFNYGEGNLVDFDSLGGLTGIFAPNASGKSNFIDIILETCFDATTRGVNKNIFLINDNREQATMVADVTANGQSYLIERTIERVKYGNRRAGEQKEWGKTSVSFSLVDEAGGHQEALVGTLRPETERNIRRRLGTYEDMLLTSLSAQWNPMDIIACKETDRKKILYKFLDLDIFDEKYRMARDEGKQYHRQLAEMEDSNLESVVSELREKVASRQDMLRSRDDLLKSTAHSVSQAEEKILLLTSQKVKVDVDTDEAAVTRELERLRDARGELNPLVCSLQDDITGADAEIEKITRLEQKFDVETHERMVTRLMEVERLLETKRRMVKEGNQSASSHRKSLKLLEEVPCGDQFPQCRFLIDAFRSKEKLPIVESNVAEWAHDVEVLEDERESLLKMKRKLELFQGFLDERRSLEALRERKRLQLENAELKLEALDRQAVAATERLDRALRVKSDVVHNQELDREILTVRKAKLEAESELVALRQEMTDLTKQLGADEGVLERLDAQLAQLSELRDTCAAYERYCDAMGKDGIAYRIMAQRLPLINEEINKILGSAAEFGVVIEHDNDEQSVRVYIQYGQYKMRLLELGSGAEKMLASVAIRAALLSISSLPKPNMFIIDEGFGKLDSRNIESVQKMFDYLKSVFEHVIVISHVDTMKDMVDNIIEISTDADGYAHIEVGGHQ